jgi:hypothetical protein
MMFLTSHGNVSLRMWKSRWFFLKKIKYVEGVTWCEHTTTFRMSNEKLKEVLATVVLLLPYEHEHVLLCA